MTNAPVPPDSPISPAINGTRAATGAFVKGYMRWADQHAVSYLGWTWDVWGCGQGPVLISSYSGTACPGYGAIYRAHLAARR